MMKISYEKDFGFQSALLWGRYIPMVVKSKCVSLMFLFKLNFRMEEGDNMKMKMLKSFLILGLVIIFSGTTPVLADGLVPLGCGMIYGYYEDTIYGSGIEDVTWLDITAGSMVYEAAAQWAESLDVFGYTDWRLPTPAELKILTRDWGHSTTYGNPGPFVNIKAEYYWTSTSPWTGFHSVVNLQSTGSSIWIDTQLGYAIAVRDGISSCAVTPKEALEGLVATVANLDIPKGMSNSLDAKLDAALGALDDLNENNDVAATNALGAFIYFVEAKRGKKISEEDADMLIQAALDIITALETP